MFSQVQFESDIKKSKVNIFKDALALFSVREVSLEDAYFIMYSIHKCLEFCNFDRKASKIYGEIKVGILRIIF